MNTPARKLLRVWPGVVIVILMWLIKYGQPVVAPDAVLYGVFAGFVGGVAIVLWWLLLGRARWFERLGAVALMIVGLFATRRFVDVSIATGAQGYLFFFLAIPVVSSALVVWAVATRSLRDGLRRATMAATTLLACGVFALIRTGGFTAATFKNDLHWRWAKTSEDRLVASSGGEPVAAAPASSSIETGPYWPGFRGPHR